MFFHVVTRTMTIMSAATIHVQIIELVTGNPKTVNSTGAAWRNGFRRIQLRLRVSPAAEARRLARLDCRRAAIAGAAPSDSPPQTSRRRTHRQK